MNAQPFCNDVFEPRFYRQKLTDAKESDDCNQIISGISYRDTNFSIADWGSSGIPNVEIFLVQIMEHGLIEYVQLSIDLDHGYMPSAYMDLNITANEFCKTLMSLSGYNALPTVQCNIKNQTMEFDEFKNNWNNYYN